MHWVWTKISSIYYFAEIPIILKQHVQSDWITIDIYFGYFGCVSALLAEVTEDSLLSCLQRVLSWGFLQLCFQLGIPGPVYQAIWVTHEVGSVNIIYWVRMAFILRGWQPRIEERPEAFSCFPTRAFLYQVSLEWISNLKGIFTLRKPWQCGLSPALDENLRYLSPAISGLPAPRWYRYVSKAPQSLAHCHASVVWWAAMGIP